MRRRLPAPRLPRVLSVTIALALASGLIVVAEPAPVAAEPLPSNPILYATPDCFVNDGINEVTIHGRNFEPNAAVVLIDYIFYQEPDARAEVTASAYGTLNARLEVKADAYYYYNKIAAYYSGSEVELASVFVGGCGTDSEVTAITKCGDPDNPSIRVSGSRWAAPPTTEAPLRLGLYQGDVLVGEISEFPAAETWEHTFQPGVTLAPGEYTIIARQDVTSFETEFFGYAHFQVPCPQVTVTPDCWQVGAPPGRMTVSVSGVGFLPRTGGEGEGEIQIVFDPTGEPQEFFYETPNGLAEDGSFGPLEINPFARPETTYTVQVKQQGFGNDVTLDQTVSFTVPCFTPAVTIRGDCGPPALPGDIPRRYEIELTGSDFAPGLDVTIVFDPEGLAGVEYPAETFTEPVDSDGTFSRTIDPLFRPPGSYRIRLYQETAFGLYEANLTFVVPCADEPPAAITIEPPCEQVATNIPLAYSINVTGTDFWPGPVQLQFDPTGSLEVGAATANQSGTFGAPFPVNGRRPGQYDVVAQQVTATGLVKQAATIFVVSCEGAVLVITPGSGPAGFVPLVEGFNFPTETTLLLRWDHGIDAGEPMPVTTDLDGTFRQPVLIFHGDFLGRRNLSVELPTDPAVYADLSVPYLVVQRTVSPPFVVDNPFAAPDQVVVRR